MPFPGAPLPAHFNYGSVAFLQNRLTEKGLAAHYGAYPHLHPDAPNRDEELRLLESKLHDAPLYRLVESTELRGTGPFELFQILHAARDKNYPLRHPTFTLNFSQQLRIADDYDEENGEKEPLWTWSDDYAILVPRTT